MLPLLVLELAVLALEVVVVVVFSLPSVEAPSEDPARLSRSSSLLLSFLPTREETDHVSKEKVAPYDLGRGHSR